MTRIADNVLDVTQFYAYASREDTLDYAKEALTQAQAESDTLFVPLRTS